MQLVCNTNCTSKELIDWRHSLMTASTNNKIINIRVVAAKENIEETISQIISNLSNDFELLKQSKPYSSRHNANETRVYLEFVKKDKDSGIGAELKPRPGDVVKGS